MRLLALVLAACAHAAPPTPAPIVVREQPRTCVLPAVPEPHALVGFPTAETIYVSVSDLADLMTYLVSVNTWTAEVARCLR